MKLVKNYLAAAAIAVIGVGTFAIASVSAYGSYGGYNRDSGYGSSSGRAVSYINPDTGAATANPDVDPASSCFKADQYDTQKLSDAATNRNVHNDACFLTRDGVKVDGPASFVSTGVGTIAACPDPDNAGPKTAVRSADGKRCFQSGYQEKFNADGSPVAGNNEFHARMNNSVAPGLQTVVWCSDRDNDGCDDEWNKSTVRIDWVR